MANTNVTISKAKVSAMPLPEHASGFNRKFHVDFSDVNLGTGNADTVTVNLGTIGNANGAWLVAQAIVQVTTAFAGTTAFTVQVGTTTSANAFITATSVLSAGCIQPTNGASTVAAPAAAAGTSTITIQAVFTNATGGSPSALTAGALDIFLAAYDPTKLDGPINNA